MPSAFRKGAEEGRVADKPLKKSLLWIVLGLIAFVLLIMFAIWISRWRTGRALGQNLESESSQTQVQGSSGTKTINQSTWTGVVCVDSTKRIDARILTPNVRWKVRLDADTNRVYSLYPANLGKNNHLEVGEHTVQEWMIEPGESISTAVVAWQFNPRR